MMVVPPGTMADQDLDRAAATEDLRERDLRQLPRPTVLEPRGRRSRPGGHRRVGRACRRFARRPSWPETGPGRDARPEPLVEAALSGVLAGARADRLGHHREPRPDNAGGITGGPDSGSDVSGPTTTDSYQFSGGDPRTPIAVIIKPPERRSQGACVRNLRPASGDSRPGHGCPLPSVAGCRHGGTRGRLQTDAADGFVQIDEEIQDAIRKEGQQAAGARRQAAPGDRGRLGHGRTRTTR